MATLSRAQSKHMYSWWWNSHISPKNSKWLQDNLTDMDGKVKTMIKLIEVDEDSFARRAEMYYKKRPELMKLVEEFYRAYRALVERYDHATGVIRQAHKTMSEHQVPFIMSDEGPATESSFDPDELNKDALENDVEVLKDTIARLEAENEGGVLQYKQTLERLSQLESEVSKANENSRGLNERGELLKEELARLKAEKETLLSKYMEALEKIANLENKLLLAEDYADNTGKEVEAMRETISKLINEKENVVLNYTKSLEEAKKLKVEVRDGADMLKSCEEQYHVLYMTNRSLNLKLQQTIRLLKEMEIRNQSLEDEVKNANKALDDLNMTAVMSINGLKEENFDLKEELEVKVDQRNALQQEIYCLKEDLSDLRMRHRNVVDQVESLGFDPDSIGSSVKELKDENSKLMTSCKRNEVEIAALVEKLGLMENLLFDANARFESELGKSVNAQFDIFLLKKCIHDMKDHNLALVGFCENLLEASRLSENLISELERSNRRREEETSGLTSQTKELRTGMFRLLETLETELGSSFDVYNDDDQRLLHCISVKLKSIKASLSEAWDDNHKLVVENSVLLSMLRELILNVREGNKKEADLINGAKLWETLVESLFIEIQRSGVCETLIKEKYREAIEAYEILKVESYSKCKDIDRLRERVRVLEGENLDVETKFVVDGSDILSLRDVVSSLEKHAISNDEPREIDDEEKEGTERHQNGPVNLQEFQARIQAIEKAVIKLKEHKKDEHSTIRSDSDLTTKEIEVFKSLSGSRRGTGRSSRRFDSKNGSETSLSISDSANELLMKDIMLDQTSDYSPYVKKDKNNTGSDDSVLKLWETMDQYKPYRSSVESTVENEPCVDDDKKDEYKSKTLQRLASDVQKLTNIQITVQDLKKKMSMTEEKGKSVEYDGVEEQIAETEQTISKLFDYSGKLMKKIENSLSTASSFDDSWENGSAIRRCSEQARRVSEKIGRVQLEVQKMGFVLMKQDTQKTVKGGTRLMERGSHVLLRDYLYGGGSSKTPRMRKRTHFCGCVPPAD